ncbi:MAG: quinone-dependent dihydroorotate dehydrogenase [Verrucomicrobiota bacterium]|nr:quinone-dependent dihydroorotate dehydrogenase [Verrucomicrobiota bacterium]
MPTASADLYERLIRPLLFSLDPERAHHLVLGCLRVASTSAPLLGFLRRFQAVAKPSSLFGLTFPNPIGLAAGFDKNGVALPAWEALGFGFIELGTVTARAQPGNPTPRIFRFPEQEALINRLGFNNDGAAAVAERLRRLRAQGRWPRIPVGINIGKSKLTEIEHAVEDYLHSFRVLHEFADYLVLNVSSPNTPGLRALQSEGALSDLLRAVARANAQSSKPVLLKIAPDLSSGELEAILTVCEQNGIAGIVATNTTLDHSGISAAQDQAGGLSGRPVRKKSTEIVRAIRERSQLPIVGVGGIFDAASAREKLTAGAQLLQVYTGFIYRGPGLLRQIVNDL